MASPNPEARLVPELRVRSKSAGKIDPEVAEGLAGFESSGARMLGHPDPDEPVYDPGLRVRSLEEAKSDPAREAAFLDVVGEATGQRIGREAARLVTESLPGPLELPASAVAQLLAGMADSLLVRGSLGAVTTLVDSLTPGGNLGAELRGMREGFVEGVKEFGARGTGIFRLIGSLGTEALAFGGPVVSAGQAITRGALVRAARLGLPALRRARGPVAQAVAKEARRIVEKVGETAGGYAQVVDPLSIRVAEMLGESLAVAGAVGAAVAGEQAPTGEILPKSSDAAKTALLFGLPASAAFRFGLPALVPSIRQANARQILRKTGELQARFADRAQAAQKDLEEMVIRKKALEYVDALEERLRREGGFRKFTQVRRRPQALKTFLKKVEGVEEIPKPILKAARLTGRERKKAAEELARQIDTQEVLVQQLRELENFSAPLSAYVSRFAGTLGRRSRLIRETSLAIRKAITSPDSLRQFGPAGMALVDRLNKYHVQANLGRNRWRVWAAENVPKIAEAMGVPRNVKHTKYLIPAVRAWEKTGSPDRVRQTVEAILRRQAQRGRVPEAEIPQRAQFVTDRILELTKAADERFAVLRSYGAAPPISQEKHGVVGYWAHRLPPGTEQEILQWRAENIARMFRLQGKPLPDFEDAITRAEAQVRTFTSMDPKKLSAVDFERTIPGDIVEVAKKGIKVDLDPVRAMVNHLAGLEQRIAFSDQFGFDGRIASALVSSVRELEGDAAGDLARFMFDGVMGRDYYHATMGSLFETLAGYQILTKLPFAVTLNLMQSATVPIRSGAKSWLEGAKATARSLAGKRRPQDFWAVLHQQDLLNNMFMDVFERDQPRAFASRLAGHLLTGTGFNAAERANRIIAYAGAQHDIVDTLAKASTGALRGKSLDAARRRFVEYGLDLDDAVRKIQRGWTVLDSVGGESAMLHALYRNGELTQFMPSPIRRPIWTTSPGGRLLFQFKTYSFGYGKFLKDSVLREAAEGNYRPLARLVAISPLAGEIGLGLRGLLSDRERPDDPRVRLFEDAMMFGGLGLLTELFFSAWYRSTAEFFAGPNVGDAVELVDGVGTAIRTGNIEPMFRVFYQTPLARLGASIFLKLDAGLEELEEYVDRTRREAAIEEAFGKAPTGPTPARK